MTRTHMEQYIDTNIKTYIFHELRLDLNICWFAVTRMVLQDTCLSENVFDAHS